MHLPADGLEVVYVHLPPGGPLPEWTHRRPFNAVVVVTTAVSEDWQGLVSDWLVRSGCLYMMAWGVECSSWDDSVDYATLSLHDFKDIPPESFVMTTWHEDDPLEEAFWYALFVGNLTYGDKLLDLTLILDIGDKERGAELLALFDQSRDLAKRSPD